LASKNVTLPMSTERGDLEHVLRAARVQQQQSETVLQHQQQSPATAQAVVNAATAEARYTSTTVEERTAKGTQTETD